MVEEEEMNSEPKMVANYKEEKILVSVRLRPLNERELARNDGCDWECIGENTIAIKATLADRTLLPNAYTFDRVFGFDCETKHVYEEGAKEVIMSVVRGINSTIFAYGQTSSGKTYTMNGITEYAVRDIYNYMEMHKEREFVLKFSAMEIYNEAVTDLLNPDSTPLRLLDDPEKGTIVEKITEQVIRDHNHLLELISLCAAQRKIGETTLNETSSRSHQILRLTIESSARKIQGVGSSSTLAATVNFVDLAGSERASQTLSTGSRLKEGSHINRSLLTLGTVIRKLSKGKNGHIPYRDSKLTRILQNSLGGNARTGIICTLSPARSHIEQSRNALFFASCAKEVTTNAKVNVVVSDKVLVKQLKKELAKMENELRSLTSNPGSHDSAKLLKEKEFLIEKMDIEIKELRKQRDLAESRIESMLGSVGENRISRPERCIASSDPTNVVRTDQLNEFNLDKQQQNHQVPENDEDIFALDNNTSKLVGLDPSHGYKETTYQRSNADLVVVYEEGSAVPDQECSYEALKQKIQEMQQTINCLVNLYPQDESPSYSEGDMSCSRGLKLTRSRSCRAVLTTQSSIWLKDTDHYENEHLAESEMESPTSGQSFWWKTPRPNHGDNIGDSSGKDSRSSTMSASFESDVEFDTSGKDSPTTSRSKGPGISIRNLLGNGSRDSTLTSPLTTTEKSREGEDNSGGEKGLRLKLFKAKFGAKTEKLSNTNSCSSVLSAPPDRYSSRDTDSEDDRVSVVNFKAKRKQFAENGYESQYSNRLNMEQELESSEKHRRNTAQSDVQTNLSIPFEFEKRRLEIIELWDSCHVPLVHRTYFFLLFKGEPSDSVYFEVELRRLFFLKETFKHGGSQIATPTSSLKVLNREREMLSKQVHKKFTSKERERLYQKWNIVLSTKQRSLQLVRRLWTNTRELDHLRESAFLVAKLVGFVEAGQVPKETFGLTYTPQPTNQKYFVWKHSMSSLT